MSISIEERLQELLDEKDERIEALERELEPYQEEIEVRRLAWLQHNEYPLDHETLPIPRLQLQYNPLGKDGGWSSYEVVYCLVYRHLLDVAVYVPLGHTRSDGSTNRIPINNGEIDLPFRDGAHIRSDMHNLSLPGYAICNGTVNQLTPLVKQRTEGR